ncbi:MAG TPA: protein kinase [Ktedonobacteraceae bacterium]
MDRTGQQLGNYRLTRVLGRGGFAEVYLGEHIYLKTFAGVKVLQAQLTTQEALKDFLREGQNIARLAHPYIIRVLDFGVEENVPFLVMEYAPNGTLRQRHAARVPLSVQQVVTYTNQIASALQYAHDQHLIHRDVKPENMLLSATGTLLLSDFGIATVARTSRSLSIQDISGTVAYMAPEQLQGKVGMASDQYALAVVVYEWLSGRLPFRGSFAEVASQHMFVQPPSLRTVMPGISQELERVIMTGLAKAPGERFARIESFASALEAASADDTPTYLTPSQAGQGILPTIAVDFAPPQRATPAPGFLAPTQATPVPGVFPSLHALTEPAYSMPGVTPVPPGMYSPQPVSGAAHPVPGVYTTQPVPGGIDASVGAPKRYARRALLAGIAGGMVIAIAAGAGVSYFLLAQRSAPSSTTSARATQASTAARTTPQTTPVPSQGTTAVTTAPTGQLLNTYTGNHYSVGCAAWSPSGSRVASSALNVQIWDALKGTNVVSYDGHSGPVEAVAWSPGGAALVSGGDDQTLRTWNATTGATGLTLTGHTGIVWAVAWSPDGSYLVSGSSDNRAGLWSATQGTNLFFYQGHGNTVYAVSFSADSQKVASASYDSTVQIWRTTDGGNLLTYTGHTSHVLSVAWAPASSGNPAYVASGSNDTTVQVWDSNNHGKLVTRYTQHTSTVTTLSWSPTGRMLASGDMQGQVRVWDVASGQTVYVYSGHTGAINWVAWSPNGQYLASAGKDQSVQIWQAPR